jgi:ABC-type branched-subunit amino acid transport system ATPase component
MERTPPVLEVAGLTKRYGGLTAVKDIGFELKGGEILGLIGPNGSGKTTVMRLIMGIERPTAGSVRLDGADVTGWPTYRIARKGVGIVFQHSRPLNRQTVLENIKLALLPDSLVQLAAAKDVDERARAIAERVGLAAASDPAVRRSAPARDRKGVGAQSEGGAGGRAVRRPDARRDGGLRGPHRCVSR